MTQFVTVCPGCGENASATSMKTSEDELAKHFCPVSKRRVTIDARDPLNVIVTDEQTPKGTGEN